MKKLLLVTAAVVVLATPALAKNTKPAPYRTPSITMTTTLIEKDFTNAECVAHAQEVLLLIKNKGAKALQISEPQSSSVYANDSEISLMINCVAESKTVVFIVTSVILKSDDMTVVVKLLDDIFTGRKDVDPTPSHPSENGKHWSD